MSQSLAKVAVHLVYSTKHRVAYLNEPGLRAELYAYKATILKNNVDSPVILIGGMPDHVHILCMLSRKYAIKDIVEEVKTESTKWLKRQSPSLADFHWQGGYGIFSVSESNIEQVKLYIANQEQHHRQLTFQDEFRHLCQRHGIQVDERYVWD